MNDLQSQPDRQAEKVAKLQVAAAKKVERKERAGFLVRSNCASIHPKNKPLRSV